MKKRIHPKRFEQVKWTVVCSMEALTDLLRRSDQDEWCTWLRLCELTALVRLIVKKEEKFPGGVPVSRDLAHDYVSRIWHPQSDGTIPEPLELLCRVGILRRVKPAVNFDSRMSALYQIGEKYPKRITIKINVPECLVEKLRQAKVRREARLNKSHPYREQLAKDLPRFTFDLDGEGRSVLAGLLANADKREATTKALLAIQSGVQLFTISDLDLATTSVSLCPKELKPFLVIDGQPVVPCDIGCAHPCFFPVLLIRRIEFLRKYRPEQRTDDLEAELKRLVEFLSTADIYSWGGNTEEERARHKVQLNLVINDETSNVEGIGIYLQLRRAFPILISIFRALKRRDHRDISVILQGVTEKAVGGALFEAQRLNIPGAPDTDGINCMAQHAEVVSYLLGRQVYNLTHGVRCKVGGIRYHPSQAPMGFGATELFRHEQPQPRLVQIWSNPSKQSVNGNAPHAVIHSANGDHTHDPTVTLEPNVGKAPPPEADRFNIGNLSTMQPTTK